MRPRFVLAAVGLATALVSDVAVAAPPPASEPQPPASTVSKDPASSGSTELEGQGKFGSVTARQEDAPAGDALEWDLSFGALFSTGNARSTAITGATTFRLRRSRHQVAASFLGNYGRAAVGADTEPIDTVGNLQARARYDLFLGERWSLFGMVTARHDPFQRLDLRLNVDPGVAFYVINGQKEQLRVEAGYDAQVDVRDPVTAIYYYPDGSPVYDAQGEFVHLPRTRITHAARLAAGYSNRLHEVLGFATDLEYLQSLLEGHRWRLNWNTSVSALLVAKLSLAATFTVRFDNDPLPRVKHLDTLSSVNLVYRFF
jgi:putative salt-induced outer membrane protein